jgi:hypothetical protein
MIPNGYLAKLIAQAHVEDLRRDADRSGLARAAKKASARRITSLEAPITIRPARAADAPGLAKLAELDSAEVPSLPILVAEATGRVRAAVSLADGAVIADPFDHTAGLIQLLHARAAQLRGRHPGQRRQFSSVVRRLWGWAM